MLHAQLLKFTEDKNRKSVETKSRLKLHVPQKPTEKHFSIRSFKFKDRRNSPVMKIEQHVENIELDITKQGSLLLQPLVLHCSQVRCRPKSKWPVNNFLKSHNKDTPKIEVESLKQIRVDGNRPQSARKLIIEPKILKNRAISAKTKRRVFSANQRPELPLIFTFGKEQFNE